MELGRSLDWQICRARTTQDAIREAGRTSEHGFEVGSIGHQAAFLDDPSTLENRRKPARAHQLRDTRRLSGKDWRRDEDQSGEPVLPRGSDRLRYAIDALDRQRHRLMTERTAAWWTVSDCSLFARGPIVNYAEAARRGN